MQTKYLKDKKILRSLAERYSEISRLGIQKERIERYYKTINMDEVRPIVLIDEVPWGEIKDDELNIRCEMSEHWWLEQRLRQSLYQWDHFQVDFVIEPVFRVGRKTNFTGIGIDIQEVQIKGDTGSYVASHEYSDHLKTEEDVENLKFPKVTYDKEGTEKAAELAEDIFSGLLPVEIAGVDLNYSIWDHISYCRGVDNLLMDLAVRPDFMHKTAKKFMEIAAAMIKQYLELNILETNPLLLHCTPACSKELPAVDFSGKVRLKDVWGRSAAQIFSAVSPEMHDEFDLQYCQQLFGECGLLYYGCCEPLDTKIDLLRKRFKNLRKISITPWADPEMAARNIGSDYVLSAKPNPSFVSSPNFDPKPVEQEIKQYLDSCKRYGTTCEFVLKDISTIANNPNNLTQWANTVAKILDQYY